MTGSSLTSLDNIKIFHVLIHISIHLEIQVEESMCFTFQQVYENMMKVPLRLDFLYFQMDEALICLNMF
jgi:hypothetical protein